MSKTYTDIDSELDRVENIQPDNKNYLQDEPWINTERLDENAVYGTVIIWEKWNITIWTETVDTQELIINGVTYEILVK